MIADGTGTEPGGNTNGANASAAKIGADFIVVKSVANTGGATTAATELLLTRRATAIARAMLTQERPRVNS